MKGSGLTGQLHRPFASALCPCLVRSLLLKLFQVTMLYAGDVLTGETGRIKINDALVPLPASLDKIGQILVDQPVSLSMP
jgi:hypothetical protein